MVTFDKFPLDASSTHRSKQSSVDFVETDHINVWLVLIHCIQEQCYLFRRNKKIVNIEAIHKLSLIEKSNKLEGEVCTRGIQTFQTVLHKYLSGDLWLRKLN